MTEFEQEKEITLEKLDLVTSRVRVSYTKAKAALLKADGDVIDAIVNLEDEGAATVGDFTDTLNNVKDKAVEFSKSAAVGILTGAEALAGKAGGAAHSAKEKLSDPTGPQEPQETAEPPEDES
ncbi:MAG: hypothetical protein LBS85_07625 [Clostridiales Family XIII bacterium]|nr:hypothetical protein [Clostridiales Family XIII bacterium]